MTTPTVDQDLMARLAEHRALGGVPRSEHEWLVAHGELHSLPLGAVVTAKGEVSKTLLVLLKGHVVIRLDRGAGSHKIFEWRAGDVGGTVPYSRGASPPADAVVEEPAEILTVHEKWFPEMIRECPAITTILVHAMVDRARQFTSSGLHDEKLISLGKIAAGLAHELNNPASAALRSGKMLAPALSEAEAAAGRLAAAHLSPEQFAAMQEARAACETTLDVTQQTPIARADQEDAVTEWLADHGVSDESASALVDAGVSMAVLDALAESVNDDALEASLHWMAACCQVRSLAAEIETATTRIHSLVAAVKSFTFMDRAQVPGAVDVRKGIADTFTMLAGKVKAKSVNLAFDFPDNLPPAHAIGAELNQVWMNLIDNALDAVPVGGHVAVVAKCELDVVAVHIIDDGPGIPPELKSRIFDPFFTTKGVGKGSGLGLDIARRLVQRSEGDLTVDSEPGRTEFQVRLPVEK